MPDVEQSIERRFGDLDDLFGFHTPKIVVLKDRFLGLLAISLKILIIVYLIITVILDKGYYVLEQPRGTSRMTIRMPSNMEEFFNLDLEYCTNPPGRPTKPEVAGQTMECAYMDSDQLTFPSMGNQFFIPTRRTLSSLRYSCTETDFECMRRNAVDGDYSATEFNKSTTFMAGIEEATLWISHTIEGRGQVKLEKTLTEMTGEVLDCEGNVVKKMPPKDPAMSRVEDLREHRIFKVKDLLAWARAGRNDCKVPLSLETKSGIDPDEANNTLRHDGLVMHIILDYDNTKDDSIHHVDYSMTISTMLQADPKLVTLSRISDLEEEKDNRHGIYVVVIQTGKLGAFSFAALIVSATAGLGLLAVANTITDLIAKFVMPLREEYKKLIFEYSHDFSDFKEEQEMAERRAADADSNSVNLQQALVQHKI